MRIHTIERRQIICRPIEQVFSFFADVENLDRITPPRGCTFGFTRRHRSRCALAPGSSTQFAGEDP